MANNIDSLIPMAHVADVQRSIDFYKHLGFDPVSTAKDEDGNCFWAYVRCGKADLMFTLDCESVKQNKESTVVFYLYAYDLIKLREELVAKGVNVSAINYPVYMTKGEVCLEDPDGYTLLIGQSD